MMSNPVGIYEHDLYGERITLELWSPEDFAEYVSEEVPEGVACGCIILDPDLDYLVFEAAQHDSEVGMIPTWAEGERQAFFVAKLLGVSVLDSRISGFFWFKGYPKSASEELVEKLRDDN